VLFSRKEGCLVQYAGDKSEPSYSTGVAGIILALIKIVIDKPMILTVQLITLTGFGTSYKP